MNLKIVLINAAFIAVSVGCFAQTQYLTKDEVGMTKIAEKVANKNDNDPLKRAYYEKIIREAFKQYADRYKAEATSPEGVKHIKDGYKLTIDSIKKTNAFLQKKLDDLALDKLEKKIADARKEADAFYADTISKLNSKVADLNSQYYDLAKEKQDLMEKLEASMSVNLQLSDEMTALKAKAEKADGALAKLTQKEAALANAYQACANSSLANISDTQDKSNAISSYLEFLDILDMKKEYLTPEKNSEIALIKSACAASDYYKKALHSLGIQYDMNSVNALIKEGNQIMQSNGSNLSDVNKTEFAQIITVLTDYERMTRNFNNVLEVIQEKGTIPSHLVVETNSDIAGEMAYATTGDPNCQPGKYNPLYVYLNTKVDYLRNAIKNGVNTESQLKSIIANARK